MFACTEIMSLEGQVTKAAQLGQVFALVDRRPSAVMLVRQGTDPGMHAAQV